MVEQVANPQLCCHHCCTVLGLCLGWFSWWDGDWDGGVWDGDGVEWGWNGNEDGMGMQFGESPLRHQLASAFFFFLYMQLGDANVVTGN